MPLSSLQWSLIFKRRAGDRKRTRGVDRSVSTIVFQWVPPKYWGANHQERGQDGRQERTQTTSDASLAALGPGEENIWVVTTGMLNIYTPSAHGPGD